MLELLRKLAISTSFVTASLTSAFNGDAAFGKDFVPRNLLVLGDSYSDSCNSQRYVNNDTQKVPFPTCYPVPEGRSDGGPAWPEYLRRIQGQEEKKGGPPGGSPTSSNGRSQAQTQTHVVNMAFAACTCDNSLFPRVIPKQIPDVGEQIELIQNGFNGTLASGFGPRSVVNEINSHTDVALLWIGTNDLSYFVANTTDDKKINRDSMITDPFRRGDILDYIDCIFRRFAQLYQFGYRKFVLMQMIPLELTPFYNPGQEVDEKTGVVPFGTPTAMQQNVLAANAIFPYKAQEFQRRFQDAQVEIFPSHELFRRFYFHKEEYRFTNVTGACGDACPIAPRTDLWANDLHFSARAAEILSYKILRFFKGDRGEKLLRGQH